ncbi:MAG: DUF6588 family protein [Endomicrobiia bacterium]
MKKIITYIIIFFISLCSIYAVDIFEEFKNNVQQQYLNPFTKDLTGLICSNIVNNAESLKLFSALPPSIGLNVRLYTPIKEIDDENIILQNAFQNQDFKYILMPMLQVEKGLPYNIDLIGRFSGYFYKRFIFYGFGLRYNIFSLPAGMLNISIAGFYNFLKVEDVLDMNSNSLNLVVSLNKIPIINPYIVIGFDNAEMEISEKLNLGKLKGKFSSGLRYEGGLNFSFFPFLYLNLAYSKTYDKDAYSLGLGLKF